MADTRWSGSRVLGVTVVVTVLVTLGIVALLVNIFERKQEARNPFYRVVDLTDDIDDPAVWGKNFPQQFDQYKRTVDQVRTRHGGSEAVPRTPTDADPRSVVAQSSRVGGLKISDHHVRSPVLNVNHACQTCHHWPEDELKARIETIQARTFGLRNRAMDALVSLIGDIKAARAKGATDADLEEARKLQRRAQFMLDFVEAENSTGFHAPQEAARILGESIDYARQGQLALRAR
jgi:hypothetical protein